MSEKEEIIDEIIILKDIKGERNKLSKYNKQNHKNRDLFKGHKIKPKRIFTFLIYLTLILMLMCLPWIIILLITSFGG